MRIYQRMVGALLIITLVFQMACFTIYADDNGDSGDAGTVSDGGSGNDQPTFEPKLMVESYHFSKETIYAGKTATVYITLVNTSNTTAIKNMMVTAEVDSEFMQLTRYTDSIYIPYISASGRCEIKYKFKTKADTPPGQYDMTLGMDYADKDGASYSASGKVKVDISRKAKVKFDPLIINSEAEIGDTIEAQVNAMNLGRGTIHNVRAKIKADGLTPKGTIYIGDIEAGQMGSGTVQVMVGGLTKSDEAYGETTGTVTYYYEDEAGKKGKIKKKFSMGIKAFSEYKEEEKEDHTNQWWVIMGAIGGVILIFATYSVIRTVRKKKVMKNEVVA